MALFQEDTEAGIQLAYQQPTTDGMKKYGKRLVTPSRVHEYTAYAFRQLRSGVPRPVHLDFPTEVAAARFKDASELTYYFDKGKYRSKSWPHPSAKQIDAAVQMLRSAERPMIVSSNGVFYRRGWDALKRLAEKAQIPVVESGAMKGQFPDDHPLSANAWGTWTGAREPRALPLHLFQENVRYDKVGEALGAHGEYVTTPGGFRPALERAWQVAVQESRPSVINCQSKKEFWWRETHPGMLGKIEPGCMSYYH